MKAGTFFPFFVVAMLILSNGCASPAPSPATPAPAATPVTSAVTAGPAPPAAEDLVNFVNDAYVFYQRVGKDAALREFGDRNGSFTRGERYIWATDMNGTDLAHPYEPWIVGTNSMNTTDIAGYNMNAAMHDAALHGSGFVTYLYRNPVTNTTGRKLTYVRRAGEDWYIASGIYGENLQVPPDSPADEKSMPRISFTLPATVTAIVPVPQP